MLFQFWNTWKFVSLIFQILICSIQMIKTLKNLSLKFIFVFSLLYTNVFWGINIIFSFITNLFTLINVMKLNNQVLRMVRWNGLYNLNKYGGHWVKIILRLSMIFIFYFSSLCLSLTKIFFLNTNIWNFNFRSYNFIFFLLYFLCYW